jgi:hypothetical protein
MISSIKESEIQGMRYIGVEELAIILGRSISTVRTQVTREPEKLPPQPKNKTTTQVRWLLATVWEWMLLMEDGPTECVSIDSPSSPKKRRGAPTAKEKIDAQNAGMSIFKFRMANSK